jgi:hypothetical protein
MQPLDFLAAVLPSSGVYCACEFTTPKKEHVFVESLDELLAAANKFDAAKKDAYFALANFATADNRLAENAKTMKSLFMDIDIGESKNGKKKYATRQEAAAAFEKFMTETGMADLGQPFVVSSGGGFHIYWPFDEELSIDQWKPVAENFKRLCHQEGLAIDMNVPADAARVLRVPGTNNFKKDTPRVVKILVANDKPFSFFAIDGFIRSKLKTQTYEETVAMVVNLPGTRPKAASNATTVKLLENTETLFRVITDKTKEGKGCGQLAHYMENAADDGMEPLWRALLSIAQKCEDGGEAAVWLSELHPYTPDRMAQKLREIKGPYPCLKFDSENPGICTNCPHFGKITNPLALGRNIVTETKAKEIEIQPVQEAGDEAPPQPITVHRPPPPRGFSYGKQGAVFRETQTEDSDGQTVTKQQMVLPYSLFVVNILYHEGEHIVHMLAMRPEGAVEVTLNQRAVVSKDETLKTLAEQNILASGGWNDKNLSEYVRACVEEASLAQRAIKVPDNYGWQPDNTFVFNERIYSKGQPPRHVPMRGLVNINKACVPTGTLENWRKMVNVLSAKKLYEVLALGMVGFGAPLMRFTEYDGLTFHLGSTESGTGKTLTLELAASVWGHPSKYRVSKSTSDVAMQQRMGLLHSMPLISDEITSKNRKDFEWVAGFIFDTSEGQGKERMESGANKERENTTYWKTMALLSSNTHVMDYLTGARKHSSEGEIRRVLEKTLNKVITWQSNELESISLIKNNYGVAGQVYAQYLVDNFDEVKETVATVHARIKSEFKFADDERYWHAGCACLVAGGVIAARAGIAKFPMEGIIEVLKSMVASARAMIKDNVRTAEDVLNSYVREYYGKLVVVKALDGALATSIGGTGVIDESLTRGEIFGRVEHNVTPGHVDFYIEEQLLKKFCSSMSFGYSDFKKQMEQKYHVSYMKKDLMSKTKGPPMRVNAMRISRKAEPDEDIIAEISLAAA